MNNPGSSILNRIIDLGLLEKEGRKELKKVIGFHKPDEECGFLSNWYPSPFVLHGVSYSSVEQYMMHSKALWFDDPVSAEKIMGTSDVRRIKEIGRDVKNYDDRLWAGVRQVIVFEGLYAKFSQNEELAKQLLATGDAILAECAFSDPIWGIGLRMGDRSVQEMDKWKGTNLLGFALMVVRERLKADK